MNKPVINKIAVDVIIPVKDRITVLACVSTLRSQIALASNITLGKIILCDGGSQTVACTRQLHEAAQLSSVQVIALPHKRFNKGWLLNQGIRAATAPILVMSDVDILWQAATIEVMCEAASQSAKHFYCVKSVEESEPDTTAMSRSRYAYRLIESNSGPTVEIYADETTSPYRPGYGLLCAQRRAFEQVGGYRHCFQGWGWEDQDLLIRAKLLGYKTTEIGQVTHLSHADAHRNAFNYQQSPQQTRDHNISLCLSGVSKGKLLGDLSLSNDL